MSPASNLRHNLTLVICLPMNLGPALISSHWPTSEWWVRMRTVHVRERRMCNKNMTTFSHCIPTDSRRWVKELASEKYT
jgi:hypothetical protein